MLYKSTIDTDIDDYKIYDDRLKVYKLPTLHYRQIHGDIIEVYKIITGKYEGVVAPRLERDVVSVTRGNALRLKKFRVRVHLRKYSFTNRVVSIWNSSPNKVMLADSVNCFKSRLDKFWQNQDIRHFCIVLHCYILLSGWKAARVLISVSIYLLYIILELKLKEPETEVRFSW